MDNRVQSVIDSVRKVMDSDLEPENMPILTAITRVLERDGVKYLALCEAVNDELPVDYLDLDDEE